MLEKIQQTAEFLRAKVGEMPRLAIILGTGLGPLADMIENKVAIPYSEIPNFPVSTVEGHSGISSSVLLPVNVSWPCRVVSIIMRDTT